MAKTKSMAGNQNHDDDDDASSSSCKKRFKNFGNRGVAGWSDLHHDVLFFVMMNLGFVDYVAFSRVCKSWRALTLSNRNTFITSRPPMSILPHPNSQGSSWNLKDFQGKCFKAKIPHSAGRTFVGLTCGYMILFGRETRDFWLFNPIKRHELHFPDYPFHGADGKEIEFTAILVFSPSINGWVFVVLHRTTTIYTRGKRKFSFSIEGKRRWNHVPCTLPIFDLQYFKGKIYTLHTDCNLGELRLNPKRSRKWTLLETKNFPAPDLAHPVLVSSGEKLFVISHFSSPPKNVLELDTGEMKWLSPQKTIGEYAFFTCGYYYSAAIKPETWLGARTQYKSYGYFINHRSRCVFNETSMWYFPHDSLNVNLLDE